MDPDPHPECDDDRPCEVCDVAVMYFAERKKLDDRVHQRGNVGNI